MSWKTDLILILSVRSPALWLLASNWVGPGALMTAGDVEAGREGVRVFVFLVAFGWLHPAAEAAAPPKVA